MNMTHHHPKFTDEMWGIIPDWLGVLTGMKNVTLETTKEWLDHCYQHGGGWRAFKGFTLNEDETITYPEDEPLPLLSTITLGSGPNTLEVRMYPHSWIMLMRPDRSFEICRMD